MKDYSKYVQIIDSHDDDWGDEPTFLEFLLRGIAEERETITRVVTSGQIDTFEAYKYKCGVLKGLSDVEQMIRKFNRSH